MKSHQNKPICLAEELILVVDPIPRVWRCSQTGLEIQPRPQSASGSEPSCRGWTTAAFNSFDNAHLGLDMDPFSKRALQSPVRNPLARSNYPHDSPLALSRLQITRRRFQARKKVVHSSDVKRGYIHTGKNQTKTSNTILSFIGPRSSDETVRAVNFYSEISPRN